MPEQFTQTEPLLSFKEKMLLQILDEKEEEWVPFLREAEKVFNLLHSLRNEDEEAWPPQALFDRAFNRRDQ